MKPRKKTLDDFNAICKQMIKSADMATTSQQIDNIKNTWGERLKNEFSHISLSSDIVDDYLYTINDILELYRERIALRGIAKN